MKQYRAFTLVEILISIALFSMIILTLYKVLDEFNFSSKFYTKKLDEISSIKEIKMVFFNDFLKMKEESLIIEALDTSTTGNMLLQFQSYNYYHNPFYSHITYMVSKQNNLLRIESAEVFERKSIQEGFFKTAYIDTIVKDVDSFKVEQKEKKLNLYVIKKDGEIITFHY